MLYQLRYLALFGDVLILSLSLLGGASQFTIQGASWVITGTDRNDKPAPLALQNSPLCFSLFRLVF